MELVTFDNDRKEQIPMPTVNGQEVETGCYIDGHWGQYGIVRLCEVADSFQSEQAESLFMATLPQSDTPDTHCPYPSIDNETVDGWEQVIDTADKAEKWLNSVTSEGFSWGWHDGEFFLWSNESWEEVS